MVIWLIAECRASFFAGLLKDDLVEELPYIWFIWQVYAGNSSCTPDSCGEKGLVPALNGPKQDLSVAVHSAVLLRPAEPGDSCHRSDRNSGT